VGDMALFPSEAWLTECVDKLNTSEEYEKAATTWEGNLRFVIEGQPDIGIATDLWTWVDLWHGKCRDFKYGLTPEEGEKARFTIRAPFSRWKQVVKQELDPVKGMMQGKLKLTGDMPTIVRHVRAAEELVNIAGSVPTQFVDEPAS